MRLFLAAAIVTVTLVGCAASSDPESTSESAAAVTAPPYVPPPEYAEGKPYSDLTPTIIANLKTIHAANTGSSNAFIKIGDSITFSTSFLDCFATTPFVDPTDTADDPANIEDTRTFFTAASWSRQSIASTVGWHTNQPLAGDPSPLSKEIAAMQPAFAVVMLGTNDEYEGTQPTYEKNLNALVTALTAQGIVPILSTIPPIRNATQNEVVPKMNLIVRKVAAENQIPMMDFHDTLVNLPGYGLGPDGIHPTTASTGACDFSSAAMSSGYNQRNLLTIGALDLVRHAVLDDATDASSDDDDDDDNSVDTH